MRRAAPIRLALAAALAGGGLAGCGSGGDGDGQIDSGPAPKGLTVSVPSMPGTLDPALARTPAERAIAAAINAPLLTYRRSDDTDAATLEPALATDLPTLSADHAEYRFQLRPGLLYADGQVVTASDVERAISHASVDAADPELRSVLDEIVGAPSQDGQTLPGVMSDDRSGTVVVRLRRPDGRLPFALADPATAPLPALPARDLKTLPASTGSLRVARVTSNSVILVANPLRARISTVPEAAATQVSITSRKPTAHALASGSIDVVMDPALGPAPAGTTRINDSSGAVWSLVLPAQGVLAARSVREALAEALDRRNLASDADPATVATTPGASTPHASRSVGGTTPTGATTPTTPLLTPSSGVLSVDDDASGGLAPACGLLPAFVVGAVVRDDCPPAPTIAKDEPLANTLLRVAVTGNDFADLQLATILQKAVAQLGGSVVFQRSAGPAALATSRNSTVDAAIVRASPSFPHPAGWLAPAAAVDTLIARQSALDQAGPLTGSAKRWSALEKRAIDRAVVVPLAVGRSAVEVGPDVEHSSVLLHPVLGLDLTALDTR